MSFTDDMYYPDPDPLPFPQSYWVLPGRFMAGQYPGSADSEEMQDKLGSMLDSGIDFILNLMIKDERNFMGRPFVPYQTEIQSLARQRGLEVTCKRMSIVDMDIPPHFYMKRILDTIDQALASEHTVYVHCLGGVGRTGTVVGCYLARQGIATGQAALEHMNELRDYQPGYDMESPQTSAQIEMVRSWMPGQ